MRTPARSTVFRHRPDRAVVLLSWLSLAGCKTAAPLAAADGGIDGPAPALDGPAPDAADRPDDRSQADTLPAPDLAADAAQPIPQQCRVTTTRQPPFQVTFRLVNRGALPVYLSMGCDGVRYSVSSCASRYTDYLVPPFLCACDCQQAGCNSNPSCGACPPDQGVAVAPGATKELSWAAVHVTTEDRGTFTCRRTVPLPAAIYSVSVPVFDAAEQARTGSRPRLVSRTFELPAPNDVVEVALLAAPTDGGAADAGVCEEEGPVPTCATPFSPATPCALDGAYTFGWEGGLSFSTEQSELVPPNRYRRTRTFRNPQPAVSCTNLIPRCGADHDTFTTADVVEALAAPDVVAALAQSRPQVYGYDYRANDGSVLVVRRLDGRGLIIGAPCGPGSPCDRPITAGLDRLKVILGKIDGQQLALPGCEALREP